MGEIFRQGEAVTSEQGAEEAGKAMLLSHLRNVWRGGVTISFAGTVFLFFFFFLKCISTKMSY